MMSMSYLGQDAYLSHDNGRERPSVAGLVMDLEQILAEISVKVPPDGVYMVGVVLRIVVLNEESRRLYTVIVGLALFRAAGPGKINVLAGLLDLLLAGLRDLLGHIARIVFEQRHQQRELFGAHFRSRQSGGLALQRGLAVGHGQDIFVGVRTHYG